MHKADQQDVSCTRIHASKFQAASLAPEEDSLFNVSTARKSSIEARGICAVCGIRANREDLQSCSYCGSPLCPDCKKQAHKRAKKSMAQY